MLPPVMPSSRARPSPIHTPLIYAMLDTRFGDGAPLYLRGRCHAAALLALPLPAAWPRRFADFRHITLRRAMMISIASPHHVE